MEGIKDITTHRHIMQSRVHFSRRGLSTDTPTCISLSARAAHSISNAITLLSNCSLSSLNNYTQQENTYNVTMYTRNVCSTCE